MVIDGGGRLVFVNTLFGCLATASETHSFIPLWRPPFLSKLAAEDRCHLNGLTLRDGWPAYVTAVSTSDVADGWRDHRRDGGVVVDVRADTIVAAGLSMPHSPRWHGDRLWLLNAGSGEVGFVDLAHGAFEPNDGFDDILIGALRASPNGSLSGQSYVVYGGTGVPATVGGTHRILSPASSKPGRSVVRADMVI